MYRTFLKGHFSENYNIEVPKQMVKGLEKIKRQRTDLVISDVMMPRWNGFECAGENKSIPDLKHISRRCL